jgi:WS/DGAT/MGAT family acyltransferase
VTTLSPLDATFLELEEADPTAHMHIGAILVFEPLPGGGAPSLEDLRAQTDERLDQLPRYRDRLSRRTVGRLTWPSWEPDPHFDVAAHVRRAALPAPGDEQELLDWAADFFSHRLDRARPLWKTVLLEGLEGGRWALATKTHHALVDGVGSVGVVETLLDAEPCPATPRARPPARMRGERLGHPQLRALAGLPLRAARTGADLALHPGRALELVDRALGMAEVIAKDQIVAAPASSLNVPLSEHRRLATVTVPLGDLREVKRALGGTINDVLLAMVTGGLRRLLLGRGEALPAAPLRAMVPVNLRGADARMALGNRVASLFVHLPVAEPEPVDRLRAVQRDALALKASREAAGGSALVALAGLAPPAIHGVLSSSLFGKRLFNVTVTNVPGPQDVLYAFGAPMRTVVPIVPLAAEHAVGVAATSYAGEMCLGVLADRDSVPDVDELAAGMRAELDALRSAARRTARRPAAAPA